MKYYVDNKNSFDENNGFSTDLPVKDYKKLNLTHGDTVFFKRQSVYKEKLYVLEGIS